MSVLVGAAKCETYNRDEVYTAVKRAIDAAGGLPPLEGKRVLLKPNLLAEADDGIERGVCTHPEVVYAVGKIVQEMGGILSIADSPGGGVPNTPAGVKKTYVGCGIDKVAEELGVKLSYDLGYQRLTSPNGQRLQSFPIINAVFDADVVINIPKLKTHLFTTYTGAVKNTFGLIPGKTKSEFHPMFPTPLSFSEMLVDLNEAVKPIFTIMDAIVGMEGDGPSGGQARKMGYILASPSIYALDAECQKLIGLNPEEIATTQVALSRNLLSLDDVLNVGDEITSIPDIKMPSTYTNYVHTDSSPWYIKYPRKLIQKSIQTASDICKPVPYLSSKACNGCFKCVSECEHRAIKGGDGVVFSHLKCKHCNTCYVVCPQNAITMLPPKAILSIRKIITRYPVIKQENCIACGRCVRICPMDTIVIADRKAQINLSKCIRCYCCHEMCAYDAIELQDSAALNLLHTVTNRK